MMLGRDRDPCLGHRDGTGDLASPPGHRLYMAALTGECGGCAGSHGANDIGGNR